MHGIKTPPWEHFFKYCANVKKIHYTVFWFDAGKVVKYVLTCIIVVLWNPGDPYLQKVQELATSTVNSGAKWI